MAKPQRWESYTGPELAALAKSNPGLYGRLLEEHRYRRERGWLRLTAAEQACAIGRQPGRHAEYLALCSLLSGNRQ